MGKQFLGFIEEKKKKKGQYQLIWAKYPIFILLDIALSIPV